MLEDVLSSIATLIPSWGAQDSLPVDSLPMTYAGDGARALVLCRFTGRSAR